MIQPITAITRSRPLLTALALALIALTALAAGAQAAPLAAPPLPLPAFAGPGDFCIDDTGINPINCTASDTRIGRLTPHMTEVCTAVGDTATVQFKAELVIGATTRYDLAMYVATNGGSALNGSSCVKDVLQPVDELNAPGDPTNLSGMGPFKNEDGDSCGEANQTVGAFYMLHLMTITCRDDNNDGAVDPISTCVSWDNSANTACTGVTATMPGPGTSSKCRCQPMDPGVRLYRGYDWGDLPDTYKTLTASDGARHSIQDTNNDNTPDTITTVPAVWLGSLVDYSPNAETDGQPNDTATGDDNNIQNGRRVDDEDGVTNPYPAWGVGENNASISVTVNSSNGTCSGCRLGFWIDWNNDGDFEDLGEAYVRSVGVGTQTLTFTTPWTEPLKEEQILSARFRLYDGLYSGTISSFGLVTNGEVEDYKLVIPANPTAVEVSDFTASGDKREVRLEWKVMNASEILGFNVYRAKKVDGAKTKVNAVLITGSLGTPWEYTDSTVLGARSYYYWLEAVDVYGNSTMVGGPVEVRAKKVKFELADEAPVQ